MPPEAGAAAGTKPGVDLLLVSQFTLYGSVRKGTKPDFSGAAPPDPARATYAALLDRVWEAYEPDRVKDGVFGAMMKVCLCGLFCVMSVLLFFLSCSTTLSPIPQVALVNDGPVTLILDSRDAKMPRSKA